MAKKEEVKGKEKKVELKAHVYPKTEIQKLPQVKQAKKVIDRKKNIRLAISLLSAEGLIARSDAEALAKKVSLIK